MAMTPQTEAFLVRCRAVILEEAGHILVGDAEAARLLEVLDAAPLDAEGSPPRAALCIASCLALGGKLVKVRRTAAVFALSHRARGPLVPRTVEEAAFDAGDVMLSRTLAPLLDNVRSLGVGPTVAILEQLAEMSRQVVGAQRRSRGWSDTARWDLSDDDYDAWCEAAMAWPDEIAPLTTGAIAAKALPKVVDAMATYGRGLGVASAILRDVEAVVSAREGEEPDLWEGRHTLVVAHMMRSANRAQRGEAARILGRPVPGNAGASNRGLHDLLVRLVREGTLTRDAHERLELALGEAGLSWQRPKTVEDIQYVRALIDHYESVAYARAHGLFWIAKARAGLSGAERWLREAVELDFLRGRLAWVEAELSG